MNSGESVTSRRILQKIKNGNRDIWVFDDLTRPFKLSNECSLQVPEISGEIEVDLKLACPEDLSERALLLRFELTSTPAELKASGLMSSGNPRAGYFRYVDTKPGVAEVSTRVSIPSDVTCNRISLVPWNASGRNVIVEGFSAVRPPPMETEPHLPAFRSYRDVSRFKCARFTHETIDDFMQVKRLGPGLHTINFDGLPLDVMYTPKGAETNAFIFNAALSHLTKELPRFMAGPLFADQDANVVAVFDPSLYIDDTLMLAWYSGSRRLRLQEVLPIILRKFALQAGGRRNMLFGASGGGFAALYYARFFPSSTVIAMNPQTIIENYIPRIVAHYVSSCWEAQSELDISNAIKRDFSSDLRCDTDLYKDISIIYLQNSTDGHVQEHLIPYCESLGRKENLYLVLDFWGEGHVSPPRALVNDILNLVIGDPEHWPDRLGDTGSVLRAPTGTEIQHRVDTLDKN